MLSVEECVSMVSAQVLGPLGREEVALADALGRRLAEDVTASAPIPAFPASIMDGFAVRSSDPPNTYLVDADSLAGGQSAGPLRPGYVRYITTGSFVPEGADAVVKVEDTVQSARSDGQVEVQILVSSKPGANIRAVGSDTAKGEALLSAGCQLRASELGVLAALNRSRLWVHREPRVAVLSTGDELVELGGQPDEGRGQIIDCNRPLLCAMVKELGAIVSDRGQVPDELEHVRATLADALESADLVITSGGVSRGSKDYIKEVLGDLGELHFGEMCMKPGKPSTFATVKTGPDPAQKKLFFGLPGNPVSCFVTFNLLVAPAIQRLRGSPGSPVYPRVDVELASPVQMDPVRPEYHRARARWQSGRIVAESTGFQRSSRIASIAETNCLLEIPKAHGTLTKGTVVKALLLTGLLPEPEGFPSIAARSVQAPLAPQAPSASGDAAPRRAKVALLRWDSAGGEVTREQLATFLGPVELIEKQAPEVLEMRELLESWSQESSGMDLILVLGNFGLGAKDENILALLRSLVREAPNVADLLLRQGLEQSPLAMLQCVVAGYRNSTLLVTISSLTSSSLGDLCKLIRADRP
ncbi:Molybdopterin biosynthesis protein CNX1 (Molybdenum cofactor biosynthesis enzyme CNX1) [Includes: Molybdopterin molybdenumtransferase (MPT Mo-transferase) (Domain E) [Durusdinium trenchii]